MIAHSKRADGGKARHSALLAVPPGAVNLIGWRLAV
jgi:hypothetical protein